MAISNANIYLTIVAQEDPTTLWVDGRKLLESGQLLLC